MIGAFLIKHWEFVLIFLLIANTVVQKLKWKGAADILTLIKECITAIFTAKPGKLPMLFIGLFLLIPSLAFATANVTFEWDGNTEADLAGYRLYQSNIAGSYIYGTSSPNLKADLSRGQNPGGTETVTIQVEDGIWFWVATAYDTEGNESSPSNELTKKIDTIAPASPQNFIVALIQKIVAWIKGLFSSFRFA